MTWADHGGPECLWQSGWDKTSDYYIIPLLRKFGYKYLNALHDKYGTAFNMIREDLPSNLLFYSVGLDDDLNDDWKPVVFSTTPIGFSKTAFTKDYVQGIVRARGFLNLHTYLPYEGLMLEKSEDGKTQIKTTDWYNEQLQNIAAANKAGSLFLATTRDLNDFAMSARDVLLFTDGDLAQFRNLGNSAVHGFCIGLVDVAGGGERWGFPAGQRATGNKQSDGVRYYWFDLPAASAAPK